MTIAHAFYPDTPLNASYNGVTATGRARFDAVSEQVFVDITLSGNAIAGGRHYVYLTGAAGVAGLPADAAADRRGFNLSVGAPAARTMRWTFNRTNPNLAGLNLEVGIEVEADALPVNFVAAPANRGISATGIGMLRDGDLMSTITVSGPATAAGSFRIRFMYGTHEFDNRTIRLAAGEQPGTGGTGNQRILSSSLTLTDLPGVTGVDTGFDPSLLRLEVLFIPDLSAGPVNNVSAAGRISLFDNEGNVQVTLTSDRVGTEGFYTVTLSGAGFTVVGSNSQTTRFPAFANVREVMSFDIIITDMVAFVGAGGISMGLSHGQGDRFFYVMNFAAETVSFGDGFTAHPQSHVLAYTAHNGVYAYRVQRDADGAIQTVSTPLGNIPREQIQVSFNRRADRVQPRIRYHANPNRDNYGTFRDIRWSGTWSRTGTGEVDISRHLRRGGYMGVRRTINNNEHTLLAVIPLPARPNNAALRAERRNVYLPSIFTVADGVNSREFLQNPILANAYDRRGNLIYTPAPWEIRLLGDRGFVHREILRTEFIKPGEHFALPHDGLPRGSRGTFRIAPIETNNFIWFDGEFTSIRDLLNDPDPSTPARFRENPDNAYDRQVQDDYNEWHSLGEGNFGSPTVAFRVPNQPNAPRVDRMVMTAGRNGAAHFISRTNANMRVKVGYETVQYDYVLWVDGVSTDRQGSKEVPVWRPLRSNIPIQEVIDLFTAFYNDYASVYPQYRLASEVPGNATGTSYRFEIRQFRNNRIPSAPGFLTLTAQEFNDRTNITASVAPVVVTGNQHEFNPAAPIIRNGVNLVVTSNGGTFVANVPGSDPAVRMVGHDISGWVQVRNADGIILPLSDFGLEATVGALAAGNSRLTVRIQGRPTTAADNLGFVITVPAGYITGATDSLVIENAVVGQIDTGLPYPNNYRNEYAARLNIASGSPATITIGSIAASVGAGERHTFTAAITDHTGAAPTVAAQNRVTWSVEAAGGGTLVGTTITSGGELRVGAGQVDNVVVRAASSTRNELYTEVEVIIVAALTPAVATSVAVSTSDAYVEQGDTATFDVAVLDQYGLDRGNQNVTWTIDASTAIAVDPGTTISSAGVLTVAAGQDLGYIVVRATSVANTAIYGTASIEVVTP